MQRYLLLLPMLLGIFATVSADSWRLPTVEKYCSANKKYCLKVEPKKLESQLAYFQDKVDDKDNAGAAKGINENYCRGKFSVNGKTLWRMRLDNEVAPVSALISNKGDYVITFDNWHGIGYGDNVVVIYNGHTGTLIKKLGLSDFLSESDIYNLPASVSSIHWRGTHQIDIEKSLLTLKVVKPGKNEQFFDVRIDLKNGSVLDEVKDRIPSLQFLLSSKEAEGANPVFSVKDAPIPCPSTHDDQQISSTELNKRIISKEMPPYPPAARPSERKASPFSM